ncbi:MAG TPA: hypothetical protein PLW44_11005 [Chitinophagales bacterium]|nr:hypothetical protein [Chitinophagales bacterium]
MTEVFEGEAQILSHYLIGKNCSAAVAADFELAVSKLNITLTEAETNVYRKMLASGFIMRSVDSALALTKSQSLIRKRIFVMLALLECTTENTAYFLPQQRSIFYFFIIGLRVVRGFAFAILGLLIIKLLGIE